MQKQTYQCPKCGHKTYIRDQFHASGGSTAALFDIPNRKFMTISCAACGYTELFRAEIAQNNPLYSDDLNH